MKKSKFLVTGNRSGLGRYLFEALPCYGLNREIGIDNYRNDSFDTIVHCAYNKSRDIDNTNLYNYLYDNVLLTYELTKIPHNKFIYISTVDVYPKNMKVHKEDEVINIEEIDSIYGLTKLMSEQIVINNCKNHLILRPTALLGPYIKSNALTKLLDNDIENFTLSELSTFNYVTHEQILEVINTAMKDNLMGIFNLATNKNLNLLQISKLLRLKNFIFGPYIYDIQYIDNSKIKKLFSTFNQKTSEIMEQFIKERL